MEQVPAKIVDYATNHGFTSIKFAVKINGISFYHLNTKRRTSAYGRKTGFPLFVRLKNDDVVEATYDEAMQVIRKLTSEV